MAVRTFLLISPGVTVFESSLLSPALCSASHDGPQQPTCSVQALPTSSRPLTICSIGPRRPMDSLSESSLVDSVERLTHAKRCG